LALLVAAALGAGLWLLRAPVVAVSSGAMAGPLIGGTWAAWMAPHDVEISLFGAFVSHLEPFWKEVVVLTAVATFAAICCDYFRKHWERR
jgi:hypothetical protein